MRLSLSILFRSFLTLLPVLASGPARAATGLAGLAGYFWIMVFYLVVAVAGLIVIGLYLWFLMRRRKSKSRRAKWILRGVSIVMLLIASPVFVVSFSVSTLQADWFFIFLLYLLGLAVLLFDFIGFKKWLVGALLVAIPVYLVKVSGIIGLTEYVVVENQPIETTHILASRLGKKYFRTDDGALYRFVRDTLPEEKWLPLGSELEIRRDKGWKDREYYIVHSYARSGEYYRYQEDFKKPLLTIPLKEIRIKRYAPKYLDRVERLEEPWQATDRNILDAFFFGCCQPDWFRELIAHGADPTTIRVGERNMLHLLAADISRYEGVVESAAVLIEAGVDINGRDEQGRTPLYQAVESYSDDLARDPVKASRFNRFFRLLLDSGADPDLATRGGFTPLHEAVIWRLYETAVLLMEYRANPLIPTSGNRTALARAKSALEYSKDDIKPEGLEALVRAMEAFEQN